MFEVEKIVREVKPKAIALFGSAAKGKAGKGKNLVGEK